MTQDSFYSYKRYRYLVLNIVLLFILTIFYLLDNPIGGRNGGTVLGYTYGGIAAAGILYLMWYGIRKRSYHARFTTLKGSLAAHVWLGIALALIVPLHCAFSFGMNVHTLAYVLMMLVIVSGIWGAIRYVDLAPQIASHRGAGTVKKHLEQIRIISSDIEALLKDKSDRFLALKNEVDLTYRPSILNSLFGKRVGSIDREEASELLKDLPETENADALKLIGLVDKKRELIAETQNEAAVMTRLRIWLYLHLPISFALLAAVIIHIFTVFYYW